MSEFEDLKKQLPGCWANVEGFSQRENYLEKVRASGLPAKEIARLRDSLVRGQGIAGDWINTLRSGLDGIYKEKVREEDNESKPKIIRFMERHPTASVLMWLVSLVISGLVAIILNTIFEDPIKRLWQRF